MGRNSYFLNVLFSLVFVLGCGEDETETSGNEQQESAADTTSDVRDSTQSQSEEDTEQESLESLCQRGASLCRRQQGVACSRVELVERAGCESEYRTSYGCRIRVCEANQNLDDHELRRAEQRKCENKIEAIATCMEKAAEQGIIDGGQKPDIRRDITEL